MRKARTVDADGVDLYGGPSSEPRGFPPTRVPGTDADGLRDTGGYVHDLRHQVGTVAMLASALAHRVGSDAETPELTGHLVAETRRLDDLVAAMGRHPSAGGRVKIEAPPIVRLDELVRGLADPFRAVEGPRVRILVTAAVVRHNRLSLWRAVRNILDNAWAAAGAQGRIDVRLFTRDGFAVVDVDDDGPGPPRKPLRKDALGLAIVDNLARGWGGWVELSTGRLGGCRSRLFVPLWRDQGSGT